MSHGRTIKPFHRDKDTDALLVIVEDGSLVLRNVDWPFPYIE